MRNSTSATLPPNNKTQLLTADENERNIETNDVTITSPLIYQRDRKNNDKDGDHRIRKLLHHLCGSESFGLFLLIITAILFSVMGLFLKLAGSTGIPSTELVFFRVVFQGSFVVLCMCFWKTEGEHDDGPIERRGDENSSEKRKKKVLLIRQPYGGTPQIRNIVLLRGAMGGFGFVMFFYTIKALPLGDAISLLSLHPVMTVFAARIVLGEALKLSHIFAAVFSVVGVILISRPTFIFGNDEDGNDGNGGEPLGYLTALLGCSCASSVFILVRKAGKMGAHTLQLLFAWVTFGVFFSIVSSKVLHDADGTEWVFPPPSSRSWCYILAMCGSGSAAHFIFNYAAQIAPSGIASVARSSEAMWSYMFQIVVFGEVPKMLTVIGVAFIASSVGVIAAQKIIDEKKASALKVAKMTVHLTTEKDENNAIELKKNENYGSLNENQTQKDLPINIQIHNDDDDNPDGANDR